jgi:hypothetical protein
MEIESHIFTCIKYKNTPDAGFSSNLFLLTEAVQHSDLVKDENIKLIAKGILASVLHHKVQKHDMGEVNMRLEEWRKKNATDGLPN